MVAIKAACLAREMTLIQSTHLTNSVRDCAPAHTQRDAHAFIAVRFIASSAAINRAAYALAHPSDIRFREILVAES